MRFMIKGKPMGPPVLYWSVLQINLQDLARRWLSLLQFRQEGILFFPISGGCKVWTLRMPQNPPNVTVILFPLACFPLQQGPTLNVKTHASPLPGGERKSSHFAARSACSWELRCEERRKRAERDGALLEPRAYRPFRGIEMIWTQ